MASNVRILAWAFGEKLNWWVERLCATLVAECGTLGDEIIVYPCDLDRCKEIQENIFNFARHRQPDSYRLITETKGVRKPV